MLYRVFGIDAELLIDHAWGRETATIADIKAYRPHTNSISNGQVLPRDYGHEEGALIVREMADALCLELVAKDKVTSSIGMYIGYSNSMHIEGESGSTRLVNDTSAAGIIVPAVEKLYRRIKDPDIPVRRINISFNGIVDAGYRQLDLFTDFEGEEKENRMQKAVLSIKEKYGSNSILRGMSLEESAMMRERNNQIGGHRK